MARLLGDPRLIPLTGPGGRGRPRWAGRATTAALDAFPAGAWLIELGPLTRPELVIETLAKVLGVPETSDQAPLEHLGTVLKSRRLLLVLDNCEHLLDECARVVTSLLTTCPALAVLATSREPLMTGGECVLRVPPLSLPAPADPLDVERPLDH